MDRRKQELQSIMTRHRIFHNYLLQKKKKRKKKAFKHKEVKYKSHNYCIDPTTHFKGIQYL